MSIQDIVAIIAGVFIVLAIIAAMFHGRRSGRLGPVQQNQVAGNPLPPTQVQGPATDPWPWIKWIGGLIALVAIVVLLFVYAPVIATVATGAWANLPALTWTALLTFALILALLAYMFKDLVFKNMVVRGLTGTAVVLLWVAAVMPFLTAVLPCSSTDFVCKQEVAAAQAAKARAQRYKERMAAEAVLPRNTSKDCPGVPMFVSLNTAFREINPHGCFFYSKVESGRVVLSGPVTEKEVGPEGADLDGWTFYKARSAWGTAKLRYINCAGPKRDKSKIDCS